MIVAGVDVGNRTTEVALAEVAAGESPRFIAESLVPTTGIKGTPATVTGVHDALYRAANDAGLSLSDINLVRINEAAPVVAGIAMQAITETTLTDSSLVGHNPETPGGAGLGVGITIPVGGLSQATGAVIVVVPATCPFDEAADLIRAARADGMMIRGAIVEADDGVLIANRIGGPVIPIVDEVRGIDRVPIGQPAAIEVAPPGSTIQTLCNPFGLATLFALDAATTARLAPAARALSGVRSAVVIRTPSHDVSARRIAVGSLSLMGERGTRQIDLREGAAAVMRERTLCGTLHDVLGEPGTSAGAMFSELRRELMAATGRPVSAIRVHDLLAVDLSAPQPVLGGLSEEVAPERAVALAAMVEAGSEQSADLALHFAATLGLCVEPGGTEAAAGLRGALTTPGTDLPICVLDLGSGSTNASRIDASGQSRHLHLAGGGAMVNLLIGEELGIIDADWREDLKRYRLARADGLFALRHEDGSVQFLTDPLPANLLGRTLLLRGESLDAVPGNPPVERVVAIRRRAKQAVFGANASRALAGLSPAGNPRFLGVVALIGGSALDVELPGMLAEQFAEYGVVIGTANVRGLLGPRNAVATGLVLQHARQP